MQRRKSPRLSLQSEIVISDSEFSTKSRSVTQPALKFAKCAPTGTYSPNPKNNLSILSRTLNLKVLEDKTWLTSPLIDLVFSTFARQFPDVHFMSVDFVALSLVSSAKSCDYSHIHDIKGKNLNDNDDIIFICNERNIHWNLFRVVRKEFKELQLFEPMGKPPGRHGSLTFRSVPREVIQWLDTCFPGDISWIKHSCSAITQQQQQTPFDCGVACLLYAEKCGHHKTKEDINASTNQNHITNYRQELQQFVLQTAQSFTPSPRALGVHVADDDVSIVDAQRNLALEK